MTQTNGMAHGMPTVVAMLEAFEKIKRDTHKAPTEYKVHPDDFAELRMQLMQHTANYSSNEPMRGSGILGLRILLDYSAERMPHNAKGETK